MKRSILILIVLISILFIGGIVLFFSTRDASDQDSTMSENTPDNPVVTTTEDVVEEPYVDPFPHDQDRDGISDAEEKELGTSDYQYDTDGDGLSDAAEINKWKTDPNKRDSDGDGFADGWEVLKGYNPAGEGTL